MYKVILERHQPPSGRGFSSLPHSSFLLGHLGEEFSKHSGRYSVQPVFQQTKQFYSSLLPAFCQGKAARATAVQAERGRWQGSEFPTVPQAAPTNSGTVVSGGGCRCPMLPAFQHWPALSKQGWSFPPPCLQPVQLLLYALLVSCRKCIVLVPQFPQV